MGREDGSVRVWSLRVQLGLRGKRGKGRKRPKNFKVFYLSYFCASLQLYETGVITFIVEIRRQRLREVKGWPEVTLVIQGPEPCPPDSIICTCVGCSDGRATWLGC